MEYINCLYFQGVETDRFEWSILTVYIFKVWRWADLIRVYSLYLYFQGVEMGRFEWSILTVYIFRVWRQVGLTGVFLVFGCAEG